MEVFHFQFPIQKFMKYNKLMSDYHISREFEFSKNLAVCLNKEEVHYQVDPLD